MQYVKAVKLVADDVSKVRRPDVFRLLDSFPNLKGFPQWLAAQRPDLADEIDSCLEELRHA
jgi:hypothetical protein